MAAWSSRQSSSSIRTYNCVVVCRLVMCRVCAICKRRCKNNRERAQMIESPWYGDLRPVPESWQWGQSSAHRPSQTPEHFETLRSGRRHGAIVCWAHILRHTTRHVSQDLAAWRTVVCLDSAVSLEFPSVECSSAFYSSWFVPTDWSARAEGGNIMFYSNHCDSFKQWTPRLHFRCIPCLHPSPFSRLKWYLPAYYSNSFCSSASTDKAADPLGSKSVHLRIGLIPFKPSMTLPNCFLSIHRTDLMSFTTASDSTTNLPSPSKFLFPFSAPGWPSAKPANSRAASPSAGPLW